jgi:DNA-binding CsgD family transcriptional regulator
VSVSKGIVSWRPMLGIYETLRLGGVPDSAYSAQVLATLERARSQQGFVPWSEFIAMQDQARAFCGNDERYLAACAKFEQTFPPEMLAFADERIRAQEFCRFVFAMFDAAYLPEMRHEVRELSEDRFELEIWLPAHLCDSSSWIVGNAGALPTMTRLLGLPPMELEARLESHHGLYRFQLPAEARGRTGLASPSMRTFAQMASVAREDLSQAVQEVRSASPAGSRVSHFARTWGLTARQTEVLERLSRGSSNKEIAASLDCAVRTVEIHVSEILRKAKVESRSALLAALIAPGA